MTSSYRKIAIFLCPSLADWSWQASIKVKRIMKVNIQMFLPGLSILHCCNYRAHTGMMIGPETELAQGKLQYIPIYSGITCLSKLWAPLALPKHPSHGKNSACSYFRLGTSGQGQPLVTFKAPWLHIWRLMFTMLVVWAEGHLLLEKINERHIMSVVICSCFDRGRVKRNTITQYFTVLLESHLLEIWPLLQII